MTVDDISGLLKDVAERLQPLRLQAFPERAIWMILMDEETLIEAELDGERGVLVLSSDLAAPVESEMGERAVLALRYNAAWATTGGVRIGMDPVSDAFTLLADIAVAPLDRERLLTILRNFHERVGDWRTIIATSIGEDAAPDADGFTVLRI